MAGKIRALRRDRYAAIQWVSECSEWCDVVAPWHDSYRDSRSKPIQLE